MEFPFEEVGAALGVAEIFGDVTASFDLKSDGAALERGLEGEDALAVGVVEAFGDANDGGETAGDALVRTGQAAIGGVMTVGISFAVVIADHGGDDVAVASFEAGDIAVEGQIFAVLVVTAVADAMTDVMEKRASFELDASLNGEMVDGLELIEEHEAEFADMLGMALIVIETAAKAARGDEDLAGFGAVAMRFLTGEGVAGNFLEKAFAESDAGNDKGADIEVTREGDENKRGHGHDVGTVAADAVGLHALSDIALEKLGEPLAKQRDFEAGKAVETRAGGDVGEGFSVAAKRHGDGVREIGASGKTRFEKSANVAANLFSFCRADDAREIEGAHEADGAERNLSALSDGVVVQDAEFEAAAAKIGDEARLDFRTHGGEDGFATEARFFLGADDLEGKPGGLLDEADEGVAVLGLTGGAGGHGPILGHGVFVHETV